MTVLDGEIRGIGVQITVAVEVFEVVIEDDQQLASCLGDPVQAAVDSRRVGDVVLLDEINPRELRGHDDVQAHAREPHDEIALGQLHVVVVVRDPSDSKGNLYTAEIVNNRRAQKLVAAATP